MPPQELAGRDQQHQTAVLVRRGVARQPRRRRSRARLCTTHAMIPAIPAIPAHPSISRVSGHIPALPDFGVSGFQPGISALPPNFTPKSKLNFNPEIQFRFQTEIFSTDTPKTTKSPLYLSVRIPTYQSSELLNLSLQDVVEAFAMLTNYTEME